MKLKDNYRLPQPVRIGWRFESGFKYETIIGTVRLKSALWFEFLDGIRSASSEQEARLRAVVDGIPFIDVTSWEIGWMPEDERIIRFIAKHNYEAVI